MDRLLVFNHEFDDFNDLIEITNQLMNDLNTERSQAIRERPLDRWPLEKTELKLFGHEQLAPYAENHVISRRVSKEAMIQFSNPKYSVPIKYIGQHVMIKMEEAMLYIYQNNKLIRAHPISEKPLNYNREDYTEILQSDVLKHLDDDELE